MKLLRIPLKRDFVLRHHGWFVGNHFKLPALKFTAKADFLKYSPTAFLSLERVYLLYDVK